MVPDMEQGKWSLGHRRELDGLRGIAILLVVLGHASVPYFGSAGAAGVTVFFVLSGFLITSLLIEERTNSGRISLVRFYVRRARRLAPAFIVWTVCISAFGIVVGQGWFFTWSRLVGAITYAGNWVLATGGTLGAFNGTWSLAVEEQFYLVWPVLAVVALGRSMRVFAGLAGALLVASLVVRTVLMLHGAPVAEVYYRTDTSAVGLAAGALLAAIVHMFGPGRWRVPPWAAVAVLGAACSLKVLGLVPVVATISALMLLHSSAVSPMPWLTNRVLTWLGRRSYALYLWHMVPAWLLRDVFNVPWPLIVVTVVPCSLLLAEASWRCVERRFLRPRVLHIPVVRPSSALSPVGA